ncbi:MAG: hypothetical protein Kow0031_41790 [Anaerolineae bacterium]
MTSGWQTTHAGEPEVRKALRKTLLKYKLHQDKELFEKAYSCIRENFYRTVSKPGPPGVSEAQ